MECFGETGVIDDQGRRVGFLQTQRPLELLELRGKGGMRAGNVAALSTCPEREINQAWSRYFHTTYPQIDGLIYSSPHNEEAAVGLVPRAIQARGTGTELRGRY